LDEDMNLTCACGAVTLGNQHVRHTYPSCYDGHGSNKLQNVTDEPKPNSKGYYKQTDRGYELHGDKAEGLLKAINDCNNRLTDLENWHRNVIDTEDQSVITILNNKVKDVEGKIDTLVSENINEDMNLRGRIQRLEAWKDRRFHNISHLNNRIFELERSQHDIEEWKQGFKTWQDLTVSRLDTNWSRIEKLEKEDKLKDDNLHSLYWQIKHLEEWKRNKEDNAVRKWVGNDTKTIDKKAWEDIKSSIDSADYYIRHIDDYKDYRNNCELRIQEILDAIKKAEGIKD
jgi:hypothetical protein